MAKRRIGIMGGSFNPIHRRHLAIAASALQELQLDEIQFIPNGNPPHKNCELVDAKHRYAMTRLAVIPYDKFAISDIELNRSGTVYTADTLQLLHKQDPDSDLFFIIGEDSLFELEHWMRPLEVFSLCSFIVCMRHHHSITDHPYIQKLQAQGAQFHFLSLNPININASDIRRQISSGVVNDSLLTPEVVVYIRLMGLYGYPPLLHDGEMLYQTLSEDLSDDRLLHSFAVAHTAHRLAQIHHLDVSACEIAALLHDCAKCMSLSDQQQIAAKAGLNLPDVVYHSIGLLHGPVGAIIAREKYGMLNTDMLTAISEHTTGFAGMSKFDMVIFLADKLEPYRSEMPELDSIRTMAEHSLLKATYAILQNSKNYVTQKNRPLHPDTAKTLQWVEDQMK